MKRIIYFAALAALLAGCSKNTQSETPLRDTPISVNVLMPEIQTRAGYGRGNLPSEFYFSIDQNGDRYDYTNVVMKFEYGKWEAYESDAENAPKKLLLWEGSNSGISVTAANSRLMVPLLIRSACQMTNPPTKSSKQATIFGILTRFFLLKTA